MIQSISELKAEARERLLGHYGIAAGALFLVQMAGTAITSPSRSFSGLEPEFLRLLLFFLLEIPLTLASLCFTCGWINLLRSILRDGNGSLNDVFFCFRNHPFRVLQILLLCMVRLIPALLPLAPGFFFYQAAEGSAAGIAVLGLSVTLSLVFVFLLSLSLSQCFLIYLEDPLLPAGEVLKRSAAIMKGRKLKYLYLTFTFAGYYLLGFLSLGLGLLWVMPYHQASLLLFYEEAAGETKEPPQDGAQAVREGREQVRYERPELYSQDYWM